MKLALVADVHLDAAFGICPPQLARERRHRLREALGDAIQQAAEAQVDAILVAGDVYEHDRVEPDTANFLVALFGEIAPLCVLIAPGNHDWYGPSSLYADVEWPPNVHLFTESRLSPLELEPGFTIWGAAHRAPANTDGFLDRFRVDRDGVNVALFHGSERGAFHLQEEGKARHAPFSAAQVADAGLAHAFCGHFHAPADESLYTYPGNPEPLTFGELPEPIRGLVVATVGSDGSVARERVRVARTEVHDVVVDVTGCVSVSEVRDRVRDRLRDLSGLARVTIEGELAPDVTLVPADVEGAASGLEWVQARIGRISVAYDVEAIHGESTVRGAFVNDVLASGLDDDEKQRVIVTGLRALEGRSDLEVMA